MVTSIKIGVNINGTQLLNSGLFIRRHGGTIIGVGDRICQDLGIDVVNIEVVDAGLKFIKTNCLPWEFIYMEGSNLVFMLTP